MFKVIIYRSVFFLSLLVIFYFSIVPSSDIPNIAVLSFLTDKVIHFLIFLYLASLGLLCRFKISALFFITTIFSFGLLIEVIHFYHPYRYFEIADLVANLMGILLASYFFQKKD